MGTAIYWIGKVTGLNSIVSAILGYAIVAALAGGSLWGYGAYKYESGKSVGINQERIAWEETRKRDLAKQAARVASDQARINQIAADNLALQQKLDAEKADAALEVAIRKEAADQKPALPKSIAHALNGVR
jgi:hypothetical protein